MDVNWNQVQRVLGVTVDGIPGPGTRAALTEWQATHGLKPDGIMGPMTYAVMFPTAPVPESDTPDPAVPAVGGLTLTNKQLTTLCSSARGDLVDTIISGLPVIYREGITTNLRLAMFLGQVATETGGLRAIEENLNYSAERLHAVWPKRFTTVSAAAPYAKNPKALANKVYGDRLGNRGSDTNDGWNYRGSGMLQTTGRSNFKAAGHEDDPDELRKPMPALVSALKFWKDHNLNKYADKGDVTGLRHVINGGENGLDEARRYTSKARQLLGV